MRQRRGTHRALGLDRDVDPGALGGGLEGLGGHVGVGDAGRAGGDRYERRRGGGSRGGCRRRGRGAGGLPGGGRLPATGDGCAGGRTGRRGGVLRGRRGLAELVGDQVDDLLVALRGPERVGEGGLDQGAGQLGEDGEVVGVAAGRRGDEERQVGRAVLGAEVDGRLEAREGERRHLDPGRAAVRDRDAARKTGGGGGLARERVLDELVLAGGSAGVVHDAGEGADDVVLVRAPVGAQPDEVGGDQ